MKIWIVGSLLVLLAAPAGAEVTLALPSETGRKVAELASWGTLFADLGLQTVDSFHCRERKKCLVDQAWQVTTTAVVTATLKRVVHRARPCAPACGTEAADSSFPSGHASLAFQTIEGRRKGLKAALAVATAVGRGLGGKHWGTDLIAGAGVGFSVSRVW